MGKEEMFTAALLVLGPPPPLGIIRDRDRRDGRDRRDRRDWWDWWCEVQEYGAIVLKETNVEFDPVVFCQWCEQYRFVLTPQTFTRRVTGD